MRDKWRTTIGLSQRKQIMLAMEIMFHTKVTHRPGELPREDDL